MTTYELAASICEDFETAKTKLIADFIPQVIGAQVSNVFLGNGRITYCTNPCNTFESLIFTVYYDLDETKAYSAAVALSTGSLKFNDTALADVWNDFVTKHHEVKAQYDKAMQEARLREKEEQKLEKKRKATEKKLAAVRASAEKEIDSLINNSEKKITKTDEFYYTLGWLAKHVGTITAKMPDYLESAFIKHFGDVERTIVDSAKVGPAGYTSQWRLSMEASLVKAKEVPATLTDCLNPSGKKVSKTAFVWSLVDDYGFKFGKKQDVVEILRCVPIEYVPIFNEGMKA